MSRILHGYKVVRKSHGKLLSFVMKKIGSDKLACVEYKLNEWVRPNKTTFGPLAVFDNLENAKQFAKCFISPEPLIFECKFRISKKEELFYLEKRIIHVSHYIPPKGTMMASCVKLNMRVF